MKSYCPTMKLSQAQNTIFVSKKQSAATTLLSDDHGPFNTLQYFCLWARNVAYIMARALIHYMPFYAHAMLFLKIITNSPTSL